ncbi:MAG TPA: hypothetical protein VHT96_09680 [Clostridia bacterium]|nr:hypothetical protein [Clostridia bacterium]
MPYKRPVQNSKKYLSPFYMPNPFYHMSNPGPSHQSEKDLFGIPLPNEKEVGPLFESERKRPSPFYDVIRYIQKHVKIEDIILIGLIVLILDEAIEDDLLLIVLFYILLF